MEKITINKFDVSIKDQILESIKKASGFSDPHLEFSSRPEFGDYTTNIALQLQISPRHPDRVKRVEGSLSDSENTRDFSAAVGMTSRTLAEEIVNKLQKNKELGKIVDKIDIAGPGFINFHLSTKVLTKNLSHILEDKEKYGKSEVGKGKTWLIEHTSPNPNKAMSLAHLRNNVVGMSISNLWEATGIKVIRDCIYNDRGIAIEKMMWGYLKFGRKDGKTETDIKYWYLHQDEWLAPSDTKEKPDRFMTRFYVKGSDDYKENEDVQKIVRQMLIDWENEDEINWKLWKKTLDFIYNGQEQTLNRLSSKWDNITYEHKVYKLGKEIIQEGLKKKIFKILENGAILTDLASYGLTDTILVRGDGTTIYITQEIGLDKFKKEKFNPDKMFWVVGPDQTLWMKQVFAVDEQLGIAKLNDLVHIVYGYVSIKGKGKMSSRAGTVVFADDVLDKAKENIREIMLKSSKLDKNEIDQIAEEVGVGAVKYSILKVGRIQDIAFDYQESLSFEGNSGPYLQYTYARCKSVLNKSSKKPEIQNVKFNEEESAVARQLVKFPEVIEQAAATFSPNILAQYLYDLASSYNTLYNKHKIIGDESEEFRLALTACTAQVLKNGLYLLGIATPEKM